VYADVTPVPVAALAWDRIALDRTNRRWRRLRDMARLLLRDDHQTTSRGRTGSFSLLFAMNDLFEGYVARMLARGLRDTALRVVAGPQPLLSRRWRQAPLPGAARHRRARPGR
jgi:5-methylcytosine-specific restriction enzyme subunit McrC